MKKKGQENMPASNDPAAVIAHALRRKFAHNIFQDSPGNNLMERNCMYNVWYYEGQGPNPTLGITWNCVHTTSKRTSLYVHTYSFIGLVHYEPT